MTDKPKSEMTWTIELYREYCELHRRNYLSDDLWGHDEKKCSDEFSRFVDLERFFSQIDNKQKVFDAYDTLKQENEELQKERNELKAEVERLKETRQISMDEFNQPLELITRKDLCDEIDRLAKQLAVAVEALEFYADKDNWDDDQFCPTIWNDGNIDMGNVARAALKGKGEK